MKYPIHSHNSSFDIFTFLMTCYRNTPALCHLCRSIHDRSVQFSSVHFSSVQLNFSSIFSSLQFSSVQLQFSAVLLQFKFSSVQLTPPVQFSSVQFSYSSVQFTFSSVQCQYQSLCLDSVQLSSVQSASSVHVQFSSCCSSVGSSVQWSVQFMFSSDTVSVQFSVSSSSVVVGKFSCSSKVQCQFSSCG